MSKESNRRKTDFASSVVRLMWKTFVFGLLLALLFMVAVRYGVFGKLPELQELENPRTKLASEIYSADSELIGKLFYQEDRTNSTFEEIPVYMNEALIATEDARFRQHSGIDARALLRAISHLGRDGGGSTISQQLAKNLFHERPVSNIQRIIQKFKEWILAVEIEKRYTKDEIILMYFNTVPWGNSYGIKSASKRYFNKPTNELKIEESAVLVGMLKAPTAYNPINNLERSTTRRNVVLYQMQKYGYIPREEYDSLKVLPLETDYNFIDHNQGLATYFRSYLAKWIKDWTDRYEEATGVKYNIYDDGLKIYTTIDSRLQTYAEKAVRDHMAKLQQDFFNETKRRNRDPWYLEDQPGVVDDNYIPKMMKRTERYKTLKRKFEGRKDSIEFYLHKPVPITLFTWDGEVDTLLSPWDSLSYYKQILHCGFMSFEPQTGHIKAWVGGINHKYFQYDHVNKSANRQVGSTFKPFVYARALDDEKIEPCEEVSTDAVIVEYAEGKTWSPKNSGPCPPVVSFYEGLQRSINTATARVMKRLGPGSPEVVRQTAGKMGIDQNKFEPYPTIALGVMDLSVYEMVGAYGTFVNEGTWIEPIFVTRVEDKNGNILEEFLPKQEEALRKQTAYTICKMLEKVTYYPGTAGRLHTAQFKIPPDATIGGKTGTTQNNSDGWFMGITPNLVSGCWVGAEERAVHFRSTNLGQGANMALPIFGKYMEMLYADKKSGISYGPFVRPDVEFTIELDCDRYVGRKDNPDDVIDPDDLF